MVTRRSVLRTHKHDGAPLRNLFYRAAWCPGFMYPWSCLRPCLYRVVSPTGYLLRFSINLSHLNALLCDPPITLFFICSHLVKLTNYEVHLYRTFSNLILEILFGPQSHSPQIPVLVPFTQICTSQTDITNFTCFIWTRSLRITKTQTHVCIRAAYRLQISMNLCLERLSHSFSITPLLVYANWFHVFLGF